MLKCQVCWGRGILSEALACMTEHIHSKVDVINWSSSLNFASVIAYCSSRHILCASMAGIRMLAALLPWLYLPVFTLCRFFAGFCLSTSTKSHRPLLSCKMVLCQLQKPTCQSGQLIGRFYRFLHFMTGMTPAATQVNIQYLLSLLHPLWDVIILCTS